MSPVRIDVVDFWTYHGQSEKSAPIKQPTLVVSGGATLVAQRVGIHHG